MTPDRGCSRREANLSAESHSKEAKPWFPGADADSKRPGGHQAPQSKRAQTPGRLRLLQVKVGGGATRLRRTDRLRKSRDFQRISREGVRKASPHFVMVVGEKWQDREGLGPVLGVTVSKKVGTAVERNRVKRRIREWFRWNRAALPQTAAVVVIARRGAAQLGAAETQWELGSLLR